MDTDICASCGNERMIYDKTGWCLECSSEALGISLIVCESCHKIRTVDYPSRKTCSLCREHKLGSMRPCGVCDTGRRHRTQLVCDDCQIRYIVFIRKAIIAADIKTAALGWSIDIRRRWIRERVKRYVHDSDSQGVPSVVGNGDSGENADISNRDTTVL